MTERPHEHPPTSTVPNRASIEPGNDALARHFGTANDQRSTELPDRPPVGTIPNRVVPEPDKDALSRYLEKDKLRAITPDPLAPLLKRPTT